MNKSTLRTTKLSGQSRRGYRYYAGFSEHFVEDMLDILDLDKGSCILDPWNGSGTTTFISMLNDYKSIGVDINPVMGVVAKGRTFLDYENIDVEGLLIKSRRLRKGVRKNDELLKWFNDKTVKILRNLERTILNGKYLSESLELGTEYSTEQYFLCVVLFNSLKKLAEPYKTSNPTWLKMPRKEERGEIPRHKIEKVFVEELKRLSVSEYKKECKFSPEIIVGNSIKMTLENESIDAVITSPPYCTRIDYAVMTALELAIFNLTKDRFVELRENIIGTPMITKSDLDVKKEWGKTCLETLKLIKQHPSRASSTYYYKTYFQYFDSMYKSMVEINRLLKNKSYCVMVIQNSYYKDILVDLKEIFTEMTNNLGWKLKEVYVFNNKQSMVDLNSSSKKYRKRSVDSEQVIVLLKE